MLPNDVMVLVVKLHLRARVAYVFKLDVNLERLLSTPNIPRGSTTCLEGEKMYVSSIVEDGW